MPLSTKVTNNGTVGSFKLMLTNLTPDTTYHYRAYAINAVDTSYGGDSSFTTLAISVPEIFTGSASSITGYAASVDGNCTFDGRRPVTEKGIVWSTSANPTIAMSTKTTEGSGAGSFTSALTGLLPNTTYQSGHMLQTQ